MRYMRKVPQAPMSDEISLRGETSTGVEWCSDSPGKSLSGRGSGILGKIPSG